MAQQTAAEWLINQVEDFIDLIPVDIIEQAKQMEKDQLIKFSKYILEEFTVLDYYEYEDLEEYYNEIFKK